MANEPAKTDSNAEDPLGFDEGSGEKLAADVVVGGKYRLVRPAGFGGMGVVWVAKNLATDAEVAVKVLLAEDAGTSEAAARFRREAHAAAKLSHRGIVRIFDLVELEGKHAGALLMVMELLRGQTLADAFDERTTLDVDEALNLTVELLSALSHAHGAGIVHRDLKPENVFLSTDPDGHVTPKILDFGISKVETPDAPRITGDGALLGTPSYMSPEQARGSRDADARSDLFTMGILFYEMLAGHNPFADGSYHSVVAAILEREPKPIPELAPELWAVLTKALQKRPADRFQSADEMAEALVEVREGRAHVPADATDRVAAREPPPPMRTPMATVLTPEGVELARSRGRTVLIASFFGVLAVGVLGFAFTRGGPTDGVSSTSPTSSVAAGISGIPTASVTAAVTAPPATQLGADTLPVASGVGSAVLPSAMAAASARRAAGSGGTAAPAAPSAAPSAVGVAPKRAPAGAASSAASALPASDPAPSGTVARDPGF